LHRYSIGAIALLCFSGAATALEIGFESLVSVNASDNVFGANVGDEIEGQMGFAQFGVFGEQKGTKLRGAFSGELYSQRQLDDPDDEFTALTQFAGAAEFNITPRAFTWYVGDILGGVRSDDGLQPSEELLSDRRNVFVTGPTFTYDIDSFSRLNARFLYVYQTQDEIELETLYNASADWSVDTDGGNTWGLKFGNIYTAKPDVNFGGDFNRFSLAATWARDRGLNSYAAQLGGTRYDTDEESLNGLNASFFYGRRLSARDNFSLELSHDLRDQTLNSVETIIDSGTGLAIDGDGFFDDTRFDVKYDFTSLNSTFDIGAGVGRSAFRLLADNTGFSEAGSDQDRINYYASTGYARSVNTKTRFSATLSYTKQEFESRVDNSQSLVGLARVTRRLSRSFEVELGYRASVSDGLRTLNSGNGQDTLEEIDSVENRVTLGLRWAPPTRASKDLTIQLKSLLR